MSLGNDLKLTQNCTIAARHIRRNVAEFLLVIIIPEDESVLAKSLLGLIVYAGIIKIALFRVGKEALGFRTPELRPTQGREDQKWQKRAKTHALSHVGYPESRRKV